MIHYGIIVRKDVNALSFYIILQSILDEKHLSIPEAARLCGLSDGTLRSAIARKQKKVALEVAFKLSKGLHVSLERLNGMPEKEISTAPDPPPTSKESRLLSNYRDLNEEGQEKLVDYSEDLVGGGRYKKHSKFSLDEKETKKEA